MAQKWSYIAAQKKYMFWSYFIRYTRHILVGYNCHIPWEILDVRYPRLDAWLFGGFFLYWCYYLHTPRDSVSPVRRTLFHTIIRTAKTESLGQGDIKQPGVSIWELKSFTIYLVLKFNWNNFFSFIILYNTCWFGCL